jgi:arginine decarboxylase
MLSIVPPLVSADFVIPYPPAFPIIVPGEVIKPDTIEFVRRLDVNDIRGCDATLGRTLINPAALDGTARTANRSKS